MSHLDIASTLSQQHSLLCKTKEIHGRLEERLLSSLAEKLPSTCQIAKSTIQYNRRYSIIPLHDLVNQASVLKISLSTLKILTPQNGQTRYLDKATQDVHP